MRAFHNDPKMKEEILQQLQVHYEADEIIKGVYWENGARCAVVYTLHSINYSEYKTRFGIPEFLAYVEDQIFEGLPDEQAKVWPLQFMKAIPVGADLALVWPKFAVWMLTDKEKGVIRFTKPDSLQEQAIKKVASFYETGFKYKEMKNARAEATVAAYATHGAALRAAGTAEEEEAVPATYASVGASVWYAAAYAEAAYALESSSSDAAREHAYQMMSNKLLELLAEHLKH